MLKSILSKLSDWLFMCKGEDSYEVSFPKVMTMFNTTHEADLELRLHMSSGDLTYPMVASDVRQVLNGPSDRMIHFSDNIDYSTSFKVDSSLRIKVDFEPNIRFSIVDTARRLILVDHYPADLLS